MYARRLLPWPSPRWLVKNHRALETLYPGARTVSRVDESRRSTRRAPKTTWPPNCELRKTTYRLRTMHEVASCARMVIAEAMFTPPSNGSTFAVN